jgi:trigger factor
MQVTETLNDGLRREFRVVVRASDLDAKLNERLDELKDRVRLNGFRPGKVPLQHLKRIYGRAAMAEAIEQAVQEVNAKIVDEHGFRLAGQPKVTLAEDESQVNEIVSGKADLSYSVALEILPKIELADFKDVKLQKLTAEIADPEIDEGIQRIAEANRPYSAKQEGAAENGDRVVLSFVGTVDGQPFEGGTADDVPLVLGSKSFIPGFEDQLVGIKAGEQRTVSVTFPEDYGSDALKGKAAQFAVTAKSVEAPANVEINDEFA